MILGRLFIEREIRVNELRFFEVWNDFLTQEIAGAINYHVE